MALYHKFIRSNTSWTTNGGPTMRHVYTGQPCPVEFVDVRSIIDSFGGRSGLLRQGRPTGPIIGDCDDFYEGDIPSRPPTVITDVDRKTPGKFKEFQAAVKAGRIVLKPRRVSKFLLHHVAGPEKPLPHDVYGTLRSWANFDQNVDVTPVHDSCDWTGLWDKAETYAGMPLEQPFRESRTNGTTRQTLYKMGITHNISGLVLPDDDRVVKAVIAQLPDLIEIDRSLVTSTVAEANSGIYDLLTEVGELKSTISFVFGILSEILRLSAQLKKDMFRARARPLATAASIADELASIWMAYRYAVMPLAYTADDLLEYHSSTFTPYATVRRGSSADHSFDLPYGWKASGSIKTIDRCYVKTRFGLEKVLHDLKFNPLATAWELIPLSFVVDWALNVGDFLSALVAPQGIAERGVQYSRQIRETSIIIESTLGYGGHYVLQGSSYHAGPIDPLDHIGLKIDFSMSWKRWLDALALSWGASKNLYKKGS